jgi:DNA-binding IclR family transcriptional regulator
MFFSPGLELDPALLAFVKCHVTSPVKWEVMRMLASHDGAWASVNQMARRTQRPVSEVAHAVNDLAADGIVEVLAATHDDVSFRLPPDEPTSIVLHRLIDMATHSLELRAIIAAHLQRMRTTQQAQSVRTSTAAA